MPNTVNKAQIYNAILDEVLQAGLASQTLEANPQNIKYDGGDTVQIATLTVPGLQGYVRDTGYTAKNVALTWDAYKITQDRGVKFSVDAMDEDETQRTLSASNVIATFAKTQEIPEIDSYRFSKIFDALKGTDNIKQYVPAKATALTQLQDDIADVQDKIGDQEPLACFISGQAFKELSKATELDRKMDVNATDGKVNLRVYDLDGVPLIVVPSARMRTDYTFSDGFEAKGYAGKINWLIVAKSAVTGFVKHQKVRVISADANQTADGELVLARIYHDLWVLKNKTDGMLASLYTEDAKAFAITTMVGAQNKVTITAGNDYTNRPSGHELYYITVPTDAAVTDIKLYSNPDLTDYTKLTEATAKDVATTGKEFVHLIEVDADGRVLRFKEAAGTT